MAKTSSNSDAFRKRRTPIEPLPLVQDMNWVFTVEDMLGNGALNRETTSMGVTVIEAFAQGALAQTSR
jgi:hypothetical protein